MKRRTALKRVALVAAATVLIPRCTVDTKKGTLALKNFTLDLDQEELVAQVVETIIPATELPGAQALGIPSFVLKMVDDCQPQPVRDKFAAGLVQLQDLSRQQFQKSFGDTTAADREALLVKVDAGGSDIPMELKEIFPVVKDLVIRGFLTAEPILVGVEKYELVPGRFHGCVNVTSNKAA